MASRPPSAGSNEPKTPAAPDAPKQPGWRDKYRPGSFRGVKFLTERSDSEGGRRVVTHEFPQRDTPWTEDLGRRAKRWTIDCLLIGQQYMDGRDALEAALELPGAGRLIHPYLGEKTVRVDFYRLSESTEEGGMARFSIDFVEAGFTLAADASADSAADAKGKATATKDGAPDKFAKKFSTKDRPSFIERAAADIAKLVKQANGYAAKLLGGAGPALRAFESGIAALDGAVQLVRVPLDFARTVRGTIGALGGLGSIPLLRIRALFNLIDDTRRAPRAIGNTADRIHERDNRDAIVALVTRVAVAEAVTTTATMSFSSYDEAVRLRDWMAGRIDALEVEAAEAGDIDLSEELAGLRLIMIRDVSARGASLARLLSVVPRVTEPALAIANRLYGPDAIEARAADIVARNAVAHPGFLPGGIGLSVLTVPEAEAGAVQ